MLILEGSDNLGKTTAAFTLVEMAKNQLRHSGANRDVLTPVHYRHMRRPAPTFDFRDDYLPMLNKSAIQDRFHLGGMVWHSRPEPYLSRDNCKFIENYISAIGGFTVIFICEDEDWYRERVEFSNREEMFDSDKLIQANNRYRCIVDSCLADYEHVVSVGPDGFASEKQLVTIFDDWYQRQKKLSVS